MMKLVKSTGLALSVCVLFSSQMFAASLSESAAYVEASVVESTVAPKAAALAVTIPNTFMADTPAVAAEVNENFTAVAAAVDALAIKTGGPKLDTPQATLEAAGWAVCFSETFDQSGTLITDVLAACNKSRIMMACRPVGEPNFVLSAEASRADVAFDTGTDLYTTHSANGTEWYMNGATSWGFAAGGDSVYKNSCDIGVLDNAEYRMCIHASGGALQSGYRCGTTTLNGNATWERVFLVK